MRILCMISSLRSGGAERAMVNLASGFIELGHQVTILHFSSDEPFYKIHKSIQVYSINKSKQKKITFIKRIRMTNAFIKDYKPNVVISFLTTTNIIGIISSRLNNIPVIVSERNDPRSTPFQWYYRVLRKIIYPLSTGYVFQTKEAQEFFSKKIQKKSQIIGNSISKEFVQTYKCNPIPYRLISVGRLEEQKNQELLIEAFAEISKEYIESELYIYGEGTYRKNLEKLITKLSLNDKVYLPGTSNNIINELLQAEIFVLTSNFEGYPNALLEAMSLSLPCISTDCPSGGVRDIIEDNINGLIVPVNDINSLIKSIKLLFESKDIRDKISENASKIRETNSIEYISKLWEAFLLKIT